jgi:hypothetical protein
LLTKKNFIQFNLIATLSFIITSVVFFLNFIIQPVSPNYFICNNLFNYKIFNLTVSYPISCDQESYYSAIRDLSVLFNEGYVYQGRPLYIFLNSNLLSILQSLSDSDLEVLTHISITITHTLVLIASSLIIMKILKIYIYSNIKTYILIYTMLILSPLYKWGTFDPSNQTFTLLIILLNVYLYLNYDKVIDPKTSLFIGLLVLIHRIFIVGYLLLFILLLLEKKYSFNFQNIVNFIKHLFISILPFLFYNIYIFIFQGQIPYDENSSHYGQFLWLPLYLFTDKRYEGGWHCMEPTTFIKCYLVDNLNLTFYLFVPLIIFLFNLLRDKSSNTIVISTLVKYVALVYIFYSFIGWYPPIRFSYYSLGHLVVVGNIYYLIKDNNRFSKSIHYLTLVLYYIFLNHWNNPNVVEFNFGVILSSICLVLYLIIKIYNKEGTNIE